MGALTIVVMVAACSGGTSVGSGGEGSDDVTLSDGVSEPVTGVDANGATLETPVVAVDGESPGTAPDAGSVEFPVISPGSGPIAAPEGTAVPVVSTGLSERPSLVRTNMPLDGASDGDGYRLVAAYPGLGLFGGAVHAAPVPGQDRMAIVERFGKVKVFVDDPAVSNTEVKLDITDRVDSSSSEQGLLGFAFDPDFATNRSVYLLYTRADPARSVITRMTWDAGSDQILPNSERTLLQVAQPFKGHNGGALEFGPDGYLYASLGDGGDGGDPRNYAQDLSSLLGKVLRIDVHPSNTADSYGIPTDNPFRNVAGARPEIYALGLRNPYRFSFDRQTGELWLADVGQNTTEEVNIITSGGNYGWRVYEGSTIYNDSTNTLPASAFTPPVYEYNHDKGIAAIGGYVYRGQAVPSLFGHYLYGDFGSGTIWALAREGGRFVNRAIATTEQPSGFAESHEGEVMVLARGGLFRFEPLAAEVVVPATLSATGLFADTGALVPVEGLIEFAPAHPFWSDGALKRRWLAVPDGSKIKFSADDWLFPVGTIAVKHFAIDIVAGDASSRRRLETRVLVNTRAGWEGYTYRWNADQQDARLLNGREEEQLSVRLTSGETRVQRYEYPSRADCAACHTRAEGYLLGPKTAQLNSDLNYPEGRANQLATLNDIGLFDRDIGDAVTYAKFAPIGDATTDVGARARAYLDVNCSSCHQPGGTAPTDIDLRADVSVASMNAVGVDPSVGTLGIAGAKIIASGNRQTSVLWQRMRRLDESRMPPLSSHRIDAAGVDLIGAWIDGGP